MIYQIFITLRYKFSLLIIILLFNIYILKIYFISQHIFKTYLLFLLTQLLLFYLISSLIYLIKKDKNIPMLISISFNSENYAFSLINNFKNVYFIFTLFSNRCIYCILTLNSSIFFFHITFYF